VIDDGEKPVDPLSSIRHMLPNMQSVDSWLGENNRGWQGFANAITVESADYDCEIVCRPARLPASRLLFCPSAHQNPRLRH